MLELAYFGDQRNTKISQTPHYQGEGAAPTKNKTPVTAPSLSSRACRGPEGQVAGERATLRPRVKGKKHLTEDEELSGARPGGRVLRSCLP